jgi:predicted dehydrogenase
MAKSKLRAGVIGCGAIAQHCHLPGYAKNPHVVLAAAADVDPARLEEVRPKFGVKSVYRDYRKMLDKEDLDLVSICTPNYLHADCTIAAAEHGCHILLEKPMALTMRDAKRMAEAARKNRVRMMLGFTHRFKRGNQEAKSLIDRGVIGKPFMVRIRFAHEGPSPGWAMSDWFYTPRKAGGGACLDMGIHAYDLCRYFLGPVTAVQADIKTLIKDIRVDDNAVLMFEFASGALGYVEVGWTSKPGFLGCEIYGTKGSIIVDYERGLDLVAGRAGADYAGGTQRRTLKLNVNEGGWAVEVTQFVDCIRTGKPFRAGIAEGISSLRVALAGYEASKTGRKVRIRE